MIQYDSWISSRLSKCQQLQGIKTELCQEILRVLSPKITLAHDPYYTFHKTGTVPPPIMVQWTWPKLCKQETSSERAIFYLLPSRKAKAINTCAAPTNGRWWAACANMYPKPRNIHVALLHQKAWWNMLILKEFWLQKSHRHELTNILCNTYRLQPGQTNLQDFLTCARFTANNMTQITSWHTHQIHWCWIQTRNRICTCPSQTHLLQRSRDSHKFHSCFFPQNIWRNLVV